MTLPDLVMQVRAWRWECNHRVKDPDWSAERKHFEDGYNSGRLSLLRPFERSVYATMTAEDRRCLDRYDEILMLEAQRRGGFPWTYETMWIEWKGNVIFVKPAKVGNPKEESHE